MARKKSAVATRPTATTPKKEAVAPTRGTFLSDENVAAAQSAMAKVKTLDDVRKVWREHLMSVGHKVLGRLLLNPTKSNSRDPKRERQAE